MTEIAIDYKVLYEELAEQHATLRQELANLKRLIYGSKNERFIPSDTVPSQLSLDIHADADTKYLSQAMSLLRA